MRRGGGAKALPPAFPVGTVCRSAGGANEGPIVSGAFLPYVPCNGGRERAYVPNGQLS